MDDNGVVAHPVTGDPSSFEILAAHYEANRHGLERGCQLVDHIYDHIDPEPIVELGIGTGSIAWPLQSLVDRDVIGVDLSPAKAQVARARLGEGRMVVADIHALPMITGKVGSLVCVWVLQLVEDLQAVIKECERVLRLDGVLAVILGGGHYEEPDDIQPIVEEGIGRFFRPGALRDEVVEAAHDVEMKIYEEGLTDEVSWLQTPASEAERLENRTYAYLQDLDDDTFAEHVLPTAERLRNLPDPDRPRVRTVCYDYLILEKRWPIWSPGPPPDGSSY